MVSLQPILATSAYPLLPSQLVGISNLQRLALYWFHAPGLQVDNEVSQSMDQPHGTVCHQHYGHRTCRRAPSSGHWRHTFSDLLSIARCHWDVFMMAPDINILSFFTYLWAKSQIQVEVRCKHSIGYGNSVHLSVTLDPPPFCMTWK